MGVVGVLAGCGGGTSLTAQPLSSEQLTEAAEASAEAPSGRFEFALDMTFPGAPLAFAFSGQGAYDTEAERSSFTADLSSLRTLLGGLVGGLGGANDKNPLDLGNADAWRIDAVQDGSVVYLRFPAIASELPEGKSWVRVDPARAAQAGGVDLSELSQFTGTDPRSLLDFLEAVAGDIETVGTEELRGVETTHYRATIDLRSYERLAPPAKRQELGAMLDDLVEQAGLAEMPFDVWLDESGYVRKMELLLSAAPEGATEPLEASMTFELYDYGADVAIVPPAADEVAELSALSD
jgi:hypothetical protein